MMSNYSTGNWNVFCFHTFTVKKTLKCIAEKYCNISVFNTLEHLSNYVSRYWYIQYISSLRESDSVFYYMNYTDFLKMWRLKIEKLFLNVGRVKSNSPKGQQSCYITNKTQVIDEAFKILWHLITTDKWVYIKGFIFVMFKTIHLQLEGRSVRRAIVFIQHPNEKYSADAICVYFDLWSNNMICKLNKK